MTDTAMILSCTGDRPLTLQ